MALNGITVAGPSAAAAYSRQNAGYSYVVVVVVAAAVEASSLAAVGRTRAGSSPDCAG